MKTTLYFILTLLTFVTFAFVPNSFAQDTSPEYMVRVIYFLPKDRQPQPDIDAKLDTLIKDVQQHYAVLMESHGFGRKTFRFEADAAGNAIVHHVNGRYDNAYYQTGSSTVWEEIEEQFDRSKNIYFLALDISSDYFYGAAGIGYGDSLSGWVLVPASRFSAASHELGHAFGLKHDGQINRKLILTSIAKSVDPMTDSFCAAEWLDVHRYFNLSQEAFNKDTSVQMLTPNLASPPFDIRIRFKVTDPDGLHQAQLLKPFGYKSGVIACKGLSGESSTVEFITNELAEAGGETVILRVIDVHGNFASHSFSIDITPFLPSSEVISIPDPNLASTVWETLGLVPGDGITQLDMLRLNIINTTGRQITDLTGLEHAIFMRVLKLSKNQIRDITPLYRLAKLDTLWIQMNSISDITPLAGLTNLRSLLLSNNKINGITPLAGLTNLRSLLLSNNKINGITPLAGLMNLSVLHLSGNSISNITPLAGLTNLRRLHLSGNSISDITPLAGLVNLEELVLEVNQISDVSPLAELVNLEALYLHGNPIKDREPLFTLLEKNPDIKIYLEHGGEPLPVTLSHFRAENTNAGVVIKWITESEVDNAGFNILRSETKDGEFKVVNPTMIQGAGTTSERNTYTWKDSTAKPNVAYYYRIEDISHAGVRKQLATVHMRGLVSATGKLTTRWAALKTQN